MTPINLMAHTQCLNMHISLDSVMILLKIYPKEVVMNVCKKHLCRYFYGCKSEVISISNHRASAKQSKANLEVGIKSTC